jgi:hypothetical protein
MDEEALCGISSPLNLKTLPEEANWLVSGRHGSANSSRLIHANDSHRLSLEKRELDIKEVFAEEGYEVEFTGELGLP